MLKTMKMGLLLSGLFLLSAGTYGGEIAHETESTEMGFIEAMHNKVQKTIQYSQDIPGCNSAEFSVLRPQILTTWNALVQEGVIELSGKDQDVRPYFVILQGIVEHVLASELKKGVTALKGMIHTPMPATPLCSKGEISKELVDPSIETDLMRLLTVKTRTAIVREYLLKGGDLYVIYPQDGFTKRTEEQQKIYTQELRNFPNHLFDVPLPCETIPSDLIGATYLFEDQAGNTYVFAIKMTQANDTKDRGDFGLWFGPIDHPSIQGRIQCVSSYFEKQDCHVLDFAKRTDKNFDSEDGL